MKKLYKLIPLIQNENMKIYRRSASWILMGILILINVLMAFVMSSSMFGDMHAMDFVANSANLLAYITIASVVIAGGIVASEFSWGTIKLLLIRPVSRTKILLSKYAALLLYALLLIIVTWVSSSILGLLFFGVSHEPQTTIGAILKNYGLLSVDLLMTITFAFMISTVFRSQALAIALSFIIMFFSTTIVQILAGLEYSWGKYILFANTDLRQHLEGGYTIFEGTSLGFSVAVLIAYFVLFHLISLYVFRKRDVSV